MKEKKRFLISYINDNHPNAMEISCDSDFLSVAEAEKYIKLAITSKSYSITDIRVVGLHVSTNPRVHPGHYQQPEG